jgi:hypothetical protein
MPSCCCCRGKGTAGYVAGCVECPELFLPLTLSCTLNKSGTLCTCVDGIELTLTYTETLSLPSINKKGWGGTVTVGTSPWTIQINCTISSGQWFWWLYYKMGASGNCDFGAPDLTRDSTRSNSSTCDPFQLDFISEFHGSEGPGQECGQFLATVTL